MKKSLIALAVLAGVAGGASAQSSVTAFGVVDVNLRQIENGSTKVSQVGTDGLTSSRLGFRGVEELGGGLKASFWLEAALNPDDGTINANGKFWHRRSTVSLEGAFGEIRLGRDFAPTYTGVSNFDPFADTGVGKFTNVLISNVAAAMTTVGATVNTVGRTDNAVQYFLPKNLGGLYGSATVAPGEGTVGNKYIGARLGYAGGALDISGSYGKTQANARDDNYTIASLSAAFNFGFLKLSSSYSKLEFQINEEDLYSIGATVPVGNGLIRAVVQKADLSGGTVARFRDADDAMLYAVGYVHNLSKRTALYGTYSHIDNKGAQRFQTGATTPALAAGATSKAIEGGIRHMF